MIAADVLRVLKSKNDNLRCVDCSVNDPQWASINHGVFLCLNCAGKHRALGLQVSLVRSLTLDAWTPAQLNLMRIGGNKRFRDFMNSYSFSGDCTLQEKYGSKAAEYYRVLLQSEHEQRTLTYPPPSFQEGPTCFVNDVERQDELIGDTNLENSWWNEARTILGSVIEKAGQWANSAAETVKEVHIVESLKNGASNAIEKSRNVGESIAEKVNSEKLKNIKEKGYEVVTNVGKMARDGVQLAYNKVKKDDEREEESVKKE